MTVRELIQILQTLPPALPVYVSDWSHGDEYPMNGEPRRFAPKAAEGLGNALPERVTIG